VVSDPSLAFPVRGHEIPAIEVLVNFGVFAGREATRAEVDRLAGELLAEVGEVTIVAEDRHQFDREVEAAVHQVRIQVPRDRVPGEGRARTRIEQRILARAHTWARECIADRRVEPLDGV
jgi:hypothetical protein